MKTLEKINRNTWSIIFYLTLAVFFLILAFAPKSLLNGAMMQIIGFNNLYPGLLGYAEKYYIFLDDWSMDQFDFFLSGDARALFFITSILYFMHAGFVLYFRDKYIKVLKNKGIKKSGEITSIESDLSAVRGIGTALFSFLGIWLAFDWEAVRQYVEITGGFSLTGILWVIAISWVALHFLVSFFTRNERFFVVKKATVNMHDNFPHLVANGRMVKPFEDFGQFVEVDYLFPREESVSWNKEITEAFLMSKEIFLERWEKQ